MANRPNVLLVTIDQWRADCLGVAGHPLVRTPHLDAMAADGVRFTAHHAQATPCAPSRACLLTGTYQHTNRVVFNGTPLDAGLTNLALEARAGGYEPQLFGHTDTTIDPRTTTDDDPRLLDYEGTLPGFTVALELPEHREAWYRWLADRGHDITDRGRFLRPGPDAVPPGRGATWPPSPYAADETETAFVVDRVVDQLADLPEPWFVHVSLYRPHPPFHVPSPYHDLHDPADVDAPIPPADVAHPFLDTVRAAQHQEGRDDPDEVRQLRATYFGMVAEVDTQMGRLLDAVRPVEEHTVVAVTWDHGEMLGDHGLFGKLGYHDGAFHIPLLVRYPALGGPTGIAVDEFTENVDVMPTLLDLAGLPVPDQCQGRSLRPFLTDGRADDWRTATHWEFDFRVFAAMAGLPLDDCHLVVERDRDGMYVRFGGYPDLFVDLVADPDERHPLVDHPAMARYAERLAGWRPMVVESELVNRLATPHGMLTLSDPEG